MRQRDVNNFHLFLLVLVQPLMLINLPFDLLIQEGFILVFIDSLRLVRFGVQLGRYLCGHLGQFALWSFILVDSSTSFINIAICYEL